MNMTETISRHRTTALAMLGALLIVSITVLGGLCIVQPKDADECVDGIFQRDVRNAVECKHPGHIMEPYEVPDADHDWVRCRCAGEQQSSEQEGS